jgi:hypothetical protein
MNHLVQYTPEQIDIDEKKYRFMNVLSSVLRSTLTVPS